MYTLIQERVDVDIVMRYQPPHTRRSVRRHLEKLIRVYGPHAVGPYVLLDCRGSIPATLTKSDKATMLVMYALHNDLDLQAVPAKFRIITHYTPLFASEDA